jgi:hypothetical protein
VRGRCEDCRRLAVQGDVPGDGKSRKIHGGYRSATRIGYKGIPLNSSLLLLAAGDRTESQDRGSGGSQKVSPIHHVLLLEYSLKHCVCYIFMGMACLRTASGQPL